MPEQHMDVDFPRTAQVQVYFTVGTHHETAIFRSDIPTEELKDLFRSAAEAGPHDVVKLYSRTGQLLNISADLEANTPETRYSLQVVATDGLASGMLREETCLKIKNLEERITEIERQLKADLPLPLAVQQLQQQVDGIRQKLETCENLSWLGFYKQLPEPLSTQECRMLQYRRKSDTIKRKVRQNFLNICDSEVSESVKQWLRMPTFDSRQWEDEELLLLLQQMFLDLDFCSKFAININTLRNFLYEAYKNYNDVPFHNFRHCFCVAQMMYSITWCVDLPSKIGDLEVLILLTSCICHDLDHPGYNNIYQINAKTELAIRYNDISPLENHHCSVAFRILENEDCNIFQSFSAEEFKQVREGIIRCILATDMARHNEILQQFKEITPEFDYSNKAHVNSLSMVLIKVSDISNEARPMDVAEPWLDRLLQEFFKQSDAEKLEGLPVTPFMDREKITKPSSQCSFIGFVLLPLFEALGELLTELQDLIIQPVREALDYYKKLNEASKEERLHRKSIVSDNTEHSGENTPNVTPKSNSSTSIKMKKSLSFQNRTSSKSVDEDVDTGVEYREEVDVESQPLEDVLEDIESGEEPTEVEVSEKALKFKISTEPTVGAGRKSYPGSRKGSREKVPNINNVDLVRVLQREKGKLRAGMLSFDQRNVYLGKKLSIDNPEYLDEVNKNYDMKCYNINNRNEIDDEECIISKETLNLNKRNSEHSVKTYISDEKRSILKSSECRSLTNVEKLKMNSLHSSPADSLTPDQSPRARSTSVAGTTDQPSLSKEKKKMSLLKNIKRSFNSRTFDSSETLTTDNKITTEGDTKPQQLSTTTTQEAESLAETGTKSNRSIMSRLKHFSEKFGLTMEKESKSPVPKTPKNNNSSSKRTTLTLRRSKMDPECCQSLESISKANTLPKARKSMSAARKGWKFFTGKDKSPNSLDVWASEADFNQHSDNTSIPSSSQLKTEVERVGIMEKTKSLTNIQTAEKETSSTSSSDDKQHIHATKGPKQYDVHGNNEPITKIQDIYKDHVIVTTSNNQQKHTEMI